MNELLVLPASSRVGDFIVRAVASSGRTGAVACGGARSEGNQQEPFAIVAAPVISAGWRWARGLYPELYRSHGLWIENPAERWARVELDAGTAVNRASMLLAGRCRTDRWSKAQDVAMQRAWNYADRLQSRALALWLSQRVQIVIGLTGLALAAAVHHEGEWRLAGYVELPRGARVDTA